jgi:DNA (cytosine-5)-methyltransferase 1
VVFTLRYLSVCSGIEAASIAWSDLGNWECAGVAEIDPFACAVLAHRFPKVKNFGDFTTIQRSDVGDIDLIVGGTPCQDFSVAGLRAGIAGERGKLTTEFIHLLGRLRPKWMVWENVPGVLSIDGGRAFGTFLASLGQLGYGAAYRVLNAEHFGVPQRRNRVFVVGHFGSWQRAAAVLFESASLRGDTPPRRKTRADIAHCVTSRFGSGRNDPTAETYIAPTLRAHIDTPEEAALVPEIAHTLRGEGFDASEDGTGRGTPLVAFSCKNNGADAGEVAPTLRAMEFDQSHSNGGGQVAVAFAVRGREEGAVPEIHDGGDSVGALRSASGGSSRDMLAYNASVRRIMPIEAERLQGFPDEFTLVPYRGRMATDSSRYRAIGNSMAVPVMRWIGERIAMVDEVQP